MFQVVNKTDGLPGMVFSHRDAAEEFIKQWPDWFRKISGGQEKYRTSGLDGPILHINPENVRWEINEITIEDAVDEEHLMPGTGGSLDGDVFMASRMATNE